MDSKRLQWTPRVSSVCLAHGASFRASEESCLGQSEHHVHLAVVLLGGRSPPHNAPELRGGHMAEIRPAVEEFKGGEGVIAVLSAPSVGSGRNADDAARVAQRQERGPRAVPHF